VSGQHPVRPLHCSLTYDRCCRPIRFDGASQHRDIVRWSGCQASRRLIQEREAPYLPRLLVTMTIALLILIACLSDAVLAQRNSPNKPDPTLTPGATLEVTRQELCGSAYRSPARVIPITLKRRIFDRYGLSPYAVGYNVDHLIPVRLGGSNSPNNLWPQPLSGEWNYHMKNRLERRLYKMVCSQTITLETAQQELARDWVSAYKKYITNSRPGPPGSPAQGSLR
jgi:hypothetical protein